MEDSRIIMSGIGIGALVIAILLLLPNFTSRSNENKNPTDIES